MRTFIAFNLQSETVNSLLVWLNQAKEICPSGIKWVDEKNLHITLQFLGEIEPSQVTLLSAFLQEEILTLRSFTLQNGAIQLIDKNQPRLFWLEYKVPSFIIPIHKRISSFCKDLGLTLDSKPLRFHITLGRIQREIDQIKLQQLQQIEWNMGKAEIHTVTFYQSTLHSTGPIYHSLASFTLQGGIHATR